VHEFTGQVASDIKAGNYPPFSTIICNAFSWNLLGNIELTGDGYAQTFQVSTYHLSSLSAIGAHMP
jgi:hypothetical protein